MFECKRDNFWKITNLANIWVSAEVVHSVGYNIMEFTYNQMSMWVY
jgi:hypothetical protein